jgi:hypothetical protein
MNFTNTNKMKAKVFFFGDYWLKDWSNPNHIFGKLCLEIDWAIKEEVMVNLNWMVTNRNYLNNYTRAKICQKIINEIH